MERTAIGNMIQILSIYHKLGKRRKLMSREEKSMGREPKEQVTIYMNRNELFLVDALIRTVQILQAWPFKA